MDASPPGTGETTPPDPQVVLDSRAVMVTSWEDADIPEKVVIKTMAQEYQPVTLPHRKIVRTLAANVSDSKLAAHFHRQTYTLCQGCHHHGPAVPKPPACASCHGRPFAENRLYMPGLMGAYHGQCLGCHAEMGLTKPDATNCNACHPAKE